MIFLLFRKLNMRFEFAFILFCFITLSCSCQDKENLFVGSDFDKELIVTEPLPVYFDLRNGERLGPVKSQPTGACWASAAMSSVESFWRTSNYSDEILSDINLKLFHGFDSTRNVNGNHFMATAYFTRGSGPVIKNSATDSLYLAVPELPAFITAARFLPDSAPLIKKTIMDYGAVWTMMYFRRNEFDTISNIWYTHTKRINHVVILTGWNDTMQTSTGKGCWIVQNSLGNKFGEKGFFYVPYSDPNILQYNAVWPDWNQWDPDDGISYYDTLGAVSQYGFDDTVCYGLIKFTAPYDIEISVIGTSVSLPGTRIYGEIYENFDTASKLLSGLKGVTTGYNCRFAGYYTLDLVKPLKIKKNKDFYVMMQYSHPADTLPVPVEKFLSGYADPEITSNKCWINPDIKKWPASWYPCGTDSPFPGLKFDLCIRVYWKRSE
jgi:C1A family cysteine protease